MRKPETFLSRTLTRLGFKSKTNSAKRFGEATRLRTFEPLERRQLLSVVTWTGLGSDNNWGTAANWSTNAAPTAGDDLVFSGSTRTATQNNLAAGTSFHSIEFKNNSFTLSGNSLTLTSGVIIDSGVTGTNVTLAGIGLSGNVTFNVATTSVTVSSAISGAGRLVKSGSGTLILTGADTYTGGTTISAGALQLGNGGATGSIVGDVVNSGQLIVNRTGSLTLSGVVSGAGSLSKLGSGTLILSGNNTYTGGTSISAGKLQLGSSAALGYNNLTINGGTVDLAGHGLEVRHLNGSAGGLITTNAGSATLQIDDGGTYAGRILDGSGSIGLRVEGWGDQLTLSGENTFFTGGTIIDGATVKADHNWALGYGNVTMIGGVLDLGGHDVFVFHVYGDSNSSITDTVGAGILRVSAGGNFQGDIFDSGGSVAIYAWGWGDALILGGYNSYTGGTTIDHGVVICEGENSLGYGNLTMSGGSLDLNGHYVEVTRINGDSGSLITSSAGSGMLQIDFGGSFSGTIADGANGETAIRYCGFYDYAPGRLTLSGDNSYSGGTETYDGTLILGGNTALGTGAVIINGTLDLAGYSPTIGGLNGGGHIGNGSSTTNSTLTVSGGGNFSGVISDVLDIGSKTVSLAVSGGTLILTGANTYTGGTVIDIEAALQIGDGGSTGSLTGDISDGGMLIVNRMGDLTMLGVIFGNGGLIKRGVGTLVIGGDNMFFYGDKTIESGIVRVDADWALGYGNITMAGGELDMNGHDVMAVYLNGDSGRITNGAGDSALLEICRGGNYQGEIVDGAGTVALDVMQGGDSLTLGGDNTYTGGTTIGVGSTVNAWSDAALGLGDLTLNGGTVNLNGHDLEVRHLISADSSSLIWNDGEFATLQVDEGGVFRGQIRDSGVSNLGVRSMGWGDAFSLSGANWYTGGTEVEGGELKIDSETALGYGNLTLDSGVVDMNGYETYVYGGLYGLADGRIINSGASAGLEVYQGGAYAGRILDDGVKQITLKLYGGELTLSGANTYSGGTQIYANGTLKVGADAALGVGPVDVYATLDLGGYSLTINGLTGGGTIGNSSTTLNSTLMVNGDCTFSGSINDALGSGTKKVAFVSAGGTVVLAGANTYSGGTTISGGTLQIGGSVVGNIVDNSSLVVDISGTLTLSGVISGSGSLTKAGSGTLTLSGANTYTGTTTIAQGTLNAASVAVSGGASNLGNATSAVVLGDSFGHTGILSYTGVTATFNRGLVVQSGGGEIDVVTTGKTLTINTKGIELNGPLTIGGAGSVLMSSVISGVSSLTKAGTGTLTLSGANTYTGTTTIAQGTLNAASVAVSGGASNLGNATSAVVLGDSFGHKGILSYTGVTATYTRGFNILSGGGEFDTYYSGRTLTVASAGIVADGAFTIGGSGSTTISSVISGGGSLTKTGSAALTLSGANTYTGATTIKQGTLNASSVVVSGGASNLGNATSAVVLGDTSGHKGVFSYTGTSATYTRGFNVLSGGGEVDVTTTIQALTIATAGITSGNSFAVGGSGNTVISSVISGAGKLYKTGAGKLTLSGANVYTGGTEIGGGTLAIGCDTALNFGIVTATGGALDLNGHMVEIQKLYGDYGGVIINNATRTVAKLQIDKGGDFKGVIEDGFGSVALKILGEGDSFSLRGNNYFTGGFEIINATVQTGGGMSLGYGNVTMNHGTVDLSLGNCTALSLTGDEYSSIRNSSGLATLKLLCGGSFSGVMTDSGEGVLALEVEGSTLTLSNYNRFSGGTTIDPLGTVKVGHDGALGYGAVIVNGRLNLNGQTPIIGDLSGSGLIANNSAYSVGVLVVTGSGTFSGVIADTFGSSGMGTALEVSGGLLTLTGKNTFTGYTTISDWSSLNLVGSLASNEIINNGSLSLANAGAVTLSNEMSGYGILVKSGEGALTISGDNVGFSGAIDVTGGMITLGSDTALGTGDLTMENDAKLFLNGHDNSLHPLSSFNLLNGFVSEGVLAANSSFNLYEGLIAADLIGSGSLSKNGSGTVTLVGANTYLGSTNALEGVLIVGSTQSLPTGTTVTGSGTVLSSQTTLYWNGGDGEWNATNAWHYADGTLTSWIDGSNAAFSGGAAVTISGTVNSMFVTFASGNYSVSGGQINVPYFTCIDTGSGTVSVSSDVIGAGVIAKKGSGSLALVGAPDFTGAVWADTGTLALNFTTMPTSLPSVAPDKDGKVIGAGLLTWQDSTLYHEVQTRFSDLIIDRSDMLAILNSVASRGAVTAAELSDLRMIVDNPQIIVMPDYVNVLASDVVEGNQANALYQGQTLGNLAVGSNSTQLTNLINKWFFGLDRPAMDIGTPADYGGGYYSFADLSLAGADGTFKWEDMHQGSVGDCWLIASLGSLANASQSVISNMFINNGDGTWTVRFYYNNGGIVTADYITVDQYLPKSSWGAYAYAWPDCLWIPLIEKAYAQWCETGHSGRTSVNAYSSLFSGLFYEVYMAAAGKETTTISGTSAICAALDNHEAIGFNSYMISSGLQAQYGFVAGHAYSVVGYYFDARANDYRFILKNPWGYYEPSDILASDLTCVDVVDPSGTTPAGSTLASASLTSAANMTTSFASLALNAAPDFAYSPKTISMTSSESIFNRIASQPFFENRREATSLPNESQTRADAIASLSVDFSSGFNSAEKLATAGVLEDISSDYVSLAPAADSTDSFADFDLVRHLHSHKKLTQLEDATDAVFSDENNFILL